MIPSSINHFIILSTLSSYFFLQIKKQSCPSNSSKLGIHSVDAHLLPHDEALILVHFCFLALDFFPVTVIFKKGKKKTDFAIG